jgi:hypothetical protein
MSGAPSPPNKSKRKNLAKHHIVSGNILPRKRWILFLNDLSLFLRLTYGKIKTARLLMHGAAGIV